MALEVFEPFQYEEGCQLRTYSLTEPETSANIPDRQAVPMEEKRCLVSEYVYAYVMVVFCLVHVVVFRRMSGPYFHNLYPPNSQLEEKLGGTDGPDKYECFKLSNHFALITEKVFL